MSCNSLDLVLSDDGVASSVPTCDGNISGFQMYTIYEFVMLLYVFSPRFHNHCWMCYERLIFRCNHTAVNGPFHLVTPFSQCSCHHIIMKFSRIITIDISDVHVKDEGQRSRSVLGYRSKQILSQFWNFGTVTPVWNCIWLQNDAWSLKGHRRGALLLFKVIPHIWRSHKLKNRWLGFNMSISGWQLQFKVTDGYIMTHISVRIDNLAPIWEFVWTITPILIHRWLCIDTHSF